MRPSRSFRDFLLLGALAVPLAAPVSRAGAASRPRSSRRSRSRPRARARRGNRHHVRDPKRRRRVCASPGDAFRRRRRRGSDYFLVTSIADTRTATGSTGWGPLVAMPPGSAQHYTSHATIPAGKAPGAYFVCADVDPTHLVAESNETNNRLCRPLTVTAQARRREGLCSDLTVTDVLRRRRRRGPRSRAVKLAGARTSARRPGHELPDGSRYQLAPRRWQLLFTRAARRRRAAAPRPVPSVWEDAARLAAGATKTYSGWVDVPGRPQAGLRPSKVEFMADGMLPGTRAGGCAASCRVAEVERGEQHEGRGGRAVP